MLTSRTVGGNDSILDQSPVWMVVLQVLLHITRVDVQLATVRVGADKVGVDMVGQLRLSGHVDVAPTLPRLDGTTSWDTRVVGVGKVLRVVETDGILRVVGAGKVLRVVGANEFLGIGGRLVFRQGGSQACVEH